MDIPKNCRECEYDDSCPAPHYGADGCQYEDEINRMRTRENQKGGEQHE